MLKKYNIEIAVDMDEAEAFRDFIIKQGNNATIGKTTRNYVDGAWTSTDSDANHIFWELWRDFCNYAWIKEDYDKIKAEYDKRYP